MNSKKLDGKEVRSFGVKNYWASADGKIWSDFSRKWLKPGLASNSGYAQVNVTTPDGPRRISVHRAVASAWLQNPYQKQQVNHKNGNKMDNRVENLEWATANENMRHGFRAGLSVLPAQKLNAAQVLLIRGAAAIGASRKELSAFFGITPNSTSRIIYGGGWPHLPFVA